MKIQTKEEIGFGVLGVTMVTTSILFLCLLWSPASYYLGKWSDYWENKDYVQTNIPWTQADTNLNNAEKDCFVRTANYFGTNKITATASSTSDDNSTYDCYGVKFTKIK